MPIEKIRRGKRSGSVSIELSGDELKCFEKHLERHVHQNEIAIVQLTNVMHKRTNEEEESLESAYKERNRFNKLREKIQTISES